MGFLTDFSRKARDILASTVEMAKKIGVQTLAEGVERQEEFEFLRSIGCEKIKAIISVNRFLRKRRWKSAKRKISAGKLRIIRSSIRIFLRRNTWIPAR